MDIFILGCVALKKKARQLRQGVFLDDIFILKYDIMYTYIYINDRIKF